MLIGLWLGVGNLAEAERVGPLLLAGLVWLGCATGAGGMAVRQLHGGPRLRFTNAGRRLEGGSRRECEAAEMVWRQNRAIGVFLLALPAVYAALAGIDADRRHPLLICAAVALGLAALAAPHLISCASTTRPLGGKDAPRSTLKTPRGTGGARGQEPQDLLRHTDPRLHSASFEHNAECGLW
jgi:hypothetical protein